MKTSVVRIGNSRGIRIPKILLEQCRIGAEVELEVQDGRLVIHPLTASREGWEEAFRRMVRAGDDALLDREALVPTRWDRTEWAW